ncbi:hypothetical protein Taro_005635 [Colocasia esculenta]|uniref:Uncharacterized protein n=1 Tax=Colocasia esculenta TaxID=4460 RepID=A0A843TNP3_COLES|nr:hypothetical protein [Colocasia esculenta]
MLSPFLGTLVPMQLSCLVWDSEVIRCSSRHRPDSPFSHCLSLRWFWSHVVVLGLGPQLGQATVVRAFLWCYVVALSRSSGEVGGRSQAGEQREWPVCPPLSCQWQWLGCCCCDTFPSATRCPSLHGVVAWPCLASVGIVCLALLARASGGFHFACSFDMICVSPKNCYVVSFLGANPWWHQRVWFLDRVVCPGSVVVLLVSPQPFGDLRSLDPWVAARALGSLAGVQEVRWLTGARGKTLVREAELDRAENSGSGGNFREEASKGSTRIEVWQDFFHASEDAECDSVLCVLLVVVLSRSPWSPFSTARWLTGARGKTLVREAELDRAENSGSGGDFREEASKGSTRIEVWQDFFHASEVVRGWLSRFEELCLSVLSTGKKEAVDRWLQTELRFAGLCVSVDSNQGICRQIHTVQNPGVLEDMRLSTALGWLSTDPQNKRKDCKLARRIASINSSSQCKGDTKNQPLKLLQVEMAAQLKSTEVKWSQ